MLNPLFPANSDDKDDAQSQGIDPFRASAAHKRINRIEPLRLKDDRPNPAADLIRQKIQWLYEKEPAAKQEIKEAQAVQPPSKHQKFMLGLSQSGKSLAEIQTAWHNYYVGLPDAEKHEVWQEFYANAQSSHYQQFVAQHQPQAAGPAKKAETPLAAPAEPEQPKQFEQPLGHAINPSTGAVVGDHTLDYEAMPKEQPKTKPHPKPIKKRVDHRTTADIKRQIVGRVNAGGQLKAKHHLQSLLFGLGMGCIAVLITLFSFFNDYIIAPFIQPSRQASATPLILSTDGVSPTGSTPEVIIPKINVEIPLDFSVSTTDESQIENALQDGVVHYPTTVLPGQVGNTAFFGHSSNNILNPGHYKFAFALLHDIVPGDTFYLTYGGKAYVYQVFQRQIVDPSDVSVLDNVPNYKATATLITCDPPGTSLHRLVVWGEQVSPDPNTNAAGNNTSTNLTSQTQLPSNGPSLWDRLVHKLFGWL